MIMLVTCNEGCKKQFEIKQLKERKLKDGVIETYFKCPKCGRKYICFYTDKEIRKLQAELRDKWSKDLKEEAEEKNKFNELIVLKIEYEHVTIMPMETKKLVGIKVEFDYKRLRQCKLSFPVDKELRIEEIKEKIWREINE